MLYRPLPIAVALEINLLIIEFQTKNWNCPIKTFYVFYCIILKSQTKADEPCETPGIPVQAEVAAKQHEANVSPPRLVSYLRAGRNYEIKDVLASQDAYSHRTGQCFGFFLLLCLHIYWGVGRTWLQNFMGVTLIHQLKNHIQNNQQQQRQAILQQQNG